MSQSTLISLIGINSPLRRDLNDDVQAWCLRGAGCRGVTCHIFCQNHHHIIPRNIGLAYIIGGTGGCSTALNSVGSGTKLFDGFKVNHAPSFPR